MVKINSNQLRFAGISLKPARGGRMKKRGYIVHVTKNRYFLVKILNEYNSKSEANNSLVKLLSGKVSERKLLKDYNKKESF